MSIPTQNYSNHRKLVPLYHLGVFGVFAINVLIAAWTLLFGSFSLWSAWALLNALAMVGLFFYTRLFALTVQDRVIRLEERLRLKELLPADLAPRISELTPAQLVGLRFADDTEVASLTRRVLDEKIADREAIKKLIKNWRADHLRV